MQKLKDKTKYQFNIFIRKILVVSVIITNLFFYLPFSSFAVDSDSEESKKYPALVPIAADDIISRFVKTNIYGDDSDGNDSSGTGSSKVITDYKDKGNGWGSVTKVKYDNEVERIYRNYKQGRWNNGENDYWNYSFWGDNIENSGCGPTCVAIVLSGYGYDANPRKVVQVMQNKFHRNSSNDFKYLIEPLKYIGNIEAEDHHGSVDVKKIRENLKKGRPIIANVPNHYVVCLGEDNNGNVIISDPGANDSVKYRYGKTLEEFVSHITYGYIQIKSDGHASTNNSDKSKTSKNNENEKKSKSSSSDKDSGNNDSDGGAGKVIKTSNFNSTGGYSGVYESRTTGKRFKEYKQNSSWAIKNYPSIDWTQECGMVSAMVVGSGYTDKATYEDLNDKMTNKRIC